MVTRNLTFKSSNLGSNVKLMLCFTPPTSDLFVKQFPVAWKVATLAGVGRSVFDVTWTDDLAFSANRIGSGNVVTAGNYTPIHAGETTTLKLDGSVSPPVYHFTEPVPRPGLKAVEAVNGTDGPTWIGLGFITDINARDEEMHNAIVYPDVRPGCAVTGEFTPVLSAYVVDYYKETELVKADIQSVQPIWSDNLMGLGEHTTISIEKRSDGTYHAIQLSANGMSANERGRHWDAQRAFNATLSFASVDAVSRGLKVIANHLLSNGYSVKLIVKDGGTDVCISLGLPFGRSCNQAEKEVSGIVESHGFPGRAAIEDRSGELSVRLAGSFSYWADINPASTEWYTGGNSRTGYDGAGVGLAINGVPDDVFNLDISSGPYYANGNGTGNTGKRDSTAAYSTAMLGGDVGLSAKPSYGKTRTLGRKVTSVSLADSSLA